MGLFDRVRRFFGSSRDVGGPTIVMSYGIGGASARRGTREVFAAYRTSPWFWLTNNRLAHERATATRKHLLLFDGPEDDPNRARIDRTDPRYEIMRVVRRPVQLNGRTLTPRQRNKAISLWRSLAGEAYLYKIRSAITGLPVSLAPISPLWVQRIPTRVAPTYEVQVDPDSPARIIQPRDIIPIVDPDAESCYGRGLGPGVTLADEIDTDEGAGQMGRAVLANFGQPSGLVVIEGANEKSLTVTQAMWKEKFGGPAKAGQVAFAGGKATFLPVNSSIKDSQLIEVRRFLRDLFCHVNGISPEVLGILEGSTRDSVFTSRDTFTLGAIIPWLEEFSDALDTHLVPEFATEEELCFGYSSPRPEDRDLQVRVMAVAPGAFKGRDARRVGGFDPDPSLDDKPLGTEAQRATPTQLPKNPGGPSGLMSESQALASDPAFARALVANPIIRKALDSEK